MARAVSVRTYRDADLDAILATMRAAGQADGEPVTMGAEDLATWPSRSHRPLFLKGSR